MKYLIFFLLIMLFFSCNSGTVEQYYRNYEVFDQTGLADKSWFPYKLMSTDTYEINNFSSLEYNYALGSFKYSNDKYYDSVFNSSKNKRIAFSVINAKAKLNKAGKPKWFIDTDSVDSTAFENIKYGRFYITRSKKQKKLYYILSN